MKKFVKMTFQGQPRLAVTNGVTVVDVTNPMVNFKESENYVTIEDIVTDTGRKFRYDGKDVNIVPHLYGNNFMALEMTYENGDTDMLTVNLEQMKSYCLVPVIWADVNNMPDAVTFLEKSGLAKNTGMTRGSGFVQYPVMLLDFIEIYKICPEFFNREYVEELLPDPDNFEDEDEE